MEPYSPVIFVMIDGLRPDAIDVADCPTLRDLRLVWGVDVGRTLRHALHYPTLPHVYLSQRPAQPARRHHQ